MSNLNVQHDLETYWGMPLAELLAQRFARYGTMKDVAESLNVTPGTLRNWLWQEAQYHPEWQDLSALHIGWALSQAKQKTDASDQRE